MTVFHISTAFLKMVFLPPPKSSIKALYRNQSWHIHTGSGFQVTGTLLFVFRLQQAGPKNLFHKKCCELKKFIFCFTEQATDVNEQWKNTYLIFPMLLRQCNPAHTGTDAPTHICTHMHRRTATTFSLPLYQLLSAQPQKSFSRNGPQQRRCSRWWQSSYVPCGTMCLDFWRNEKRHLPPFPGSRSFQQLRCRPTKKRPIRGKPWRTPPQGIFYLIIRLVPPPA